MAGFECSSHRRPDGLRLDLIRSTGHDTLALQDYRSCRSLGIRTVRDGVRWHLIEQQPGIYDWSSWQPMLEATEEAGVQPIWDLCHYGFPDHLQLDSATFIDAYADFAAEAARVHRHVTGRAPLVCPINEISYFAWAVNTGYFPRIALDERGWFKRHLVRAALAGVRAMRAVDPGCRFLWAEPLINILPRSSEEADVDRAEKLRLAQYEAYDMLLGRAAPELGGSPDAVDLVGLNFYPDNQWIEGGSAVPLGNHDYRPLADMLTEAFERFGKPIFISETGAERSARPSWFHYVCGEVRTALSQGVPIHGICIYPVTTYPGWDDSRHAEVGLFSTPHSDGERRVFEPMASELERQEQLFSRHRPSQLWRVNAA